MKGKKISTQKKWQFYYFFMAFSSAFIILVFLFLNTQTSSKFHEINLQNQQTFKILGGLDQLSQYLLKESAPGNNIFQSKSYLLEKKNYELAHQQLNESIKKFKSDISDLSIKKEILLELSAFNSLHLKMDQDIQKIFESIRNNNLAIATEHMAQMDQSAARLNNSLMLMRKRISLFQSEQLRLHDEYLRVNNRNVILLSIITVIGLVIALYSAFKTLIIVKKHQTKEKIYLKELEVVSERLQSILNQAPIVVYECLKNENWTMNFISTHIFEISGHESNAFINDSKMSFASIIHPEDREYVETSISNSINLNKSFSIEYRIVDSRGTIRWVWERGALSPNTGNLVGVILEITDKKIAEENLKSKSLELEQVMNAISESAIVTTTDTKGKILEANDQFALISGYSKDELIGKDHRIINSGVHSKSFFKSMWDTISSGKVWNGELENKNKNGKHYFVRTVISPVGVDNTKPDRYIAIRFDITDQVLSERKLEEAQKVAKLGSWSFDLKTQKIEWSKQMYKLFPENYYDGPPTFDRHYSTIHGEDQEMWKTTVDNCLEKGTTYKMRFRVLFPDKILWIEAHGHAVHDDNDGSITGIYGTCQDVSELVLKDLSLQEERAKVIQSAKLASLGVMSAGVAHEINNPLMVILGAAHQAARLIENTHVDLASKIAVISKSATRIVKIVEGLKKFSRSSERDKFQEKAIKNILDDIMPIAQIHSQRFNIALDFECDDRLSILCNEIEIQQVFINLINNAMDAAGESDIRWVKVKCFTDGNDAVIHVIDSGKGIELGVEHKLFEPFFTTKEVGKGTGLGLSISKGIIEEHGGKITINRNLSNTCFEVRIPKLNQ
jgi:PAS domain S-box-containing protein